MSDRALNVAVPDPGEPLLDAIADLPRAFEGHEREMVRDLLATAKGGWVRDRRGPSCLDRRVWPRQPLVRGKFSRQMPSPASVSAQIANSPPTMWKAFSAPTTT